MKKKEDNKSGRIRKKEVEENGSREGEEEKGDDEKGRKDGERCKG